MAQPAHKTDLKLLGQIIKTQRRGRNLSGLQLGKLVGLSQSKISKLEHGIPPVPGPDLLDKIFDILESPKYIRQQAHLLTVQQQSLVPVNRQYTYAFTPDLHRDLAMASSDIYIYVHNILPALVQTVSYRRALFKRFGMDDATVHVAVRQALQRQDLLFDPGKRHLILICEAALYTCPATIKEQIVQLDRLERLVDLDTSDVGILPTRGGLSVFELGSSVVYDKKRLFIQLGDGEIECVDPAQVKVHVDAYMELSQKAYYKQDAKAIIRTAIDYLRGNPGPVA